MRLTRTSALSAACVAVATAAGTLVAAPAATAAEPTAPFISEIHYDNASGDVGEFVEVQVPRGRQHRRLDGGPLQRQRRRRLHQPDRAPALTAVRPSGSAAVAVIDYPDRRRCRTARRTVSRWSTPAARSSSSCPTRGRSPRSAGRPAGTTSVDIGVAEAGTDAGGTACPSDSTRPPATTCGRRRGREHQGCAQPAAGATGRRAVRCHADAGDRLRPGQRLQHPGGRPGGRRPRCRRG